MSFLKDFKSNPEAENNGIVVEYPANNDGTIPTFIIAASGKYNKEFNKTMERETKPVRRRQQMGTLSNDEAEEILLKVFLKSVLKNWFNIKDENDNSIEYSYDAAYKLFKAYPKLYDDLTAKANDAALFREDALEIEAKN